MDGRAGWDDYGLDGHVANQLVLVLQRASGSSTRRRTGRP